MEIVKKIISFFRLGYICEYENHDYPDGVIGKPWHFYTHTCKKCGKNFEI